MKAGRTRNNRPVQGMFSRVRSLAGGSLAGMFLAVALPHAAVAAEYCVTCEGPPAMYRCVVAGTADGPGKDPSASLYCISEMATNGRHDQCAVSRGAPFPCPGLTTIVRHVPTLAPPPAAAGSEADAGAPVAGPPEENQATKPKKPDGGVPQTVEELAGETVRSSKEGLEKAGEAIGGTAKKAGEAIGGTAQKAGEQIGNAGSAIGNAASKTWTCITSLFNSCGDEPEPAAEAGAEAEAALPPEPPVH